ncbi:hypothetical protein DFJ74DRAFT_710775 [Hyaloraphidium curvatum]|nr:hypothetical protein DFJ74DRAFT_710775 [Hyaloraphidium curvatum]
MSGQLPAGAPRASPADASPTGPRAPTSSRPACLSCHTHKKRCVWKSAAPGTPCERCARLGRVCEEQGAERARPQAPPTPAATSSSGTSGDLSPASDAVPATTELPLARPDFLFACIALHWDSTHYPGCIVHRGTFESAFLQSPSPVYGADKPAALMCVLAANGGSFLRDPSLTRERRWKLVKRYFTQAENLLRAAFDGTDAPDTTVLEAAQVSTYLLRHYLGYGMVAELPAARSRARELLDRVFRSVTGPDGIPFSGAFAPTDAVSWISSEMAIRCAVLVGHSESNIASMLNRASERPPFDYHGGKVPLPCHESFFDVPDAGRAFALFRAGPGERIMADPTPLLALRPEFEPCAEVVRGLVGAFFSLRAGRAVFVYLFDLLTGLQTRARELAAKEGLDLLALAAQDPSVDTPSEAEHRARIELVRRLVAEIHLAMPDPIGTELAIGDTAAFFAGAATYFGSDGAAEAVLSMLISLQALAISSWVQGNTAAATPALFTSQPLHAALEAGIVATRLMEALLERDPTLHRCNQVVCVAALRVVSLQAAVARAGSAGAVLDNIRIGLRFNKAFFEIQPAGMRIYESLVALLSGTGVDPAEFSPPRDSPAPAADAADDLGKAFTETMMLSDRMLAEGFGRSGPDAKAAEGGGRGGKGSRALDATH